jgi:AcrR family transcriptional regulator
METTLPGFLYEDFASPAQKKRLKILESLLKIIIRDGLGQLTLSKLAAESKIAKTSVLYHFPDLHDAQLYLFKLVARTGIEITVKRMQNTVTPLGRLETIASAAFEWAVTHPDYARYFLLMHHYSSIDARFHKVHQQSVDTGIARIAEVLDEIFKKKVTKSDLHLYATSLHCLLTSAIVRMVSCNDFENVSDYMHLVEFSFSKFIGKEVSLKLI